MYALFAKRGFTETVQARATREDILLITATDLLAERQTFTWPDMKRGIE
jgi:hypothetical protein